MPRTSNRDVMTIMRVGFNIQIDADMESAAGANLVATLSSSLPVLQAP